MAFAVDSTTDAPLRSVVTSSLPDSTNWPRTAPSGKTRCGDGQIELHRVQRLAQWAAQGFVFSKPAGGIVDVLIQGCQLHPVDADWCTICIGPIGICETRRLHVDRDQVVIRVGRYPGTPTAGRITERRHLLCRKIDTRNRDTGRKNLAAQGSIRIAGGGQLGHRAFPGTGRLRTWHRMPAPARPTHSRCFPRSSANSSSPTAPA